jgi:hypothetical protein
VKRVRPKTSAFECLGAAAVPSAQVTRRRADECLKATIEVTPPDNLPLVLMTGTGMALLADAAGASPRHTATFRETWASELRC